MRQPRPAPVLCAAALSLVISRAAAQDRGGARPAAVAPAIGTVIDELLAADTAARRTILSRIQWSAEATVRKLLAAAKQANEPDRAVQILHLVGELGIGADTAAPHLIAFMNDAKRPKLAINLALKNPRTRLGPSAAIALGQLAPYVLGLRQEVTAALSVELRVRYGFHNRDLRRAYFRSLVVAGGEVADLITQLKHDIPYIRETAAEALGARGRAASAAVPALLEALVSDHPRKIKIDLNGWGGSSSETWDKFIQGAAACALVRIAPGDKRCLPAHLLVVKSESDPDLLVTALRHVGFMNREGEPALDRLCELVDHENTRVAAEAVTAIGMIGIRNDAVMAALKRASTREERAVAARATATIRILN